jgi:DNA-binding NtrC family response regulator
MYGVETSATMERQEAELAIQRVRATKVLAAIVGDAPAWRRALTPLPLIARTRSTVLITGETGTGKELVARAVHHLSDRAGGPFISVNCGALPETLVEAALFGHERGAYTDAQHRSPGLVAEAHGGTLLLDEVEALSSRAQVALLRVLQDGTFHALGSAQMKRTDARVIAVTNAPLEHLVQSGRFRSDLYFRLRVLVIDLPPLRDRADDVLRLATHFLERHAPAGTRFELDETARAALCDYAWPGNVRELEHAVLRASSLADGRQRISAADLGIPFFSRSAPALPGRFQALKREAIVRFERGYLTTLLHEHHGNVTHAARAAGKDRRELGKLLKKHRIDPQEFRSL